MATNLFIEISSLVVAQNHHPGESFGSSEPLRLFIRIIWAKALTVSRVSGFFRLYSNNEGSTSDYDEVKIWHCWKECSFKRNYWRCFASRDSPHFLPWDLDMGPGGNRVRFYHTPSYSVICRLTHLTKRVTWVAEWDSFYNDRLLFSAIKKFMCSNSTAFGALKMLCNFKVCECIMNMKRHVKIKAVEQGKYCLNFLHGILH